MDAYKILYYVLIIGVIFCGVLWNIKYYKMKVELDKLDKQNKELAIELTKAYKELCDLKQNADAK